MVTKRLLTLGATLLLSSLNLSAELPPSAYESMQREAPDVLRLNILTVQSDRATSGETVEILAEVLKVGRSETASVGDIITIRYVREDHPAGWAGPGAVPIPEEKAETVAYLKLAEGGSAYSPAAGMMTFRSF